MAYNSHGHTPAAWTTVLVIFLGVLIGALGVATLTWPLFWAGVGVMVLGGIVGKVMQMMGMGQGEAPTHPHSAATSAEATSAEVTIDEATIDEATVAEGTVTEAMVGEGSDG